jgi:hypothetical protein
MEASVKYKVVITGRQEGAIGIHRTIQRTYTIECNSREEVNQLAIDAANREGGIEHVRVIIVEKLP